MLDLIWLRLVLGNVGFIVAPPKAGRQVYLKEIANGITTNSSRSRSIYRMNDLEEVTTSERTVDARRIHFRPAQKTTLRLVN